MDRRLEPVISAWLDIIENKKKRDGGREGGREGERKGGLASSVTIIIIMSHAIIIMYDYKR